MNRVCEVQLSFLIADITSHGAREASQRLRAPSARKREAERATLPTLAQSAKRQKQKRAGNVAKSPVVVSSQEEDSKSDSSGSGSVTGAKQGH